jgi:hypothetical protein
LSLFISFHNNLLAVYYDEGVAERIGVDGRRGQGNRDRVAGGVCEKRLARRVEADNSFFTGFIDYELGTLIVGLDVRSVYSEFLSLVYIFRGVKKGVLLVRFYKMRFLVEIDRLPLLFDLFHQQRIIHHFCLLIRFLNFRFCL